MPKMAAKTATGTKSQMHKMKIFNKNRQYSNPAAISVQDITNFNFNKAKA